METNNFDPILNPKAKESRGEKLEISSTGYGLESVQKEMEEEGRNQKKAKGTNSSYGGL
ncbi:hypothetical protein [Niallia nealsonii]|uniref:hypothetical protein n=1 Tax=Niallia nealsonii TaxID=115979 RepID=UPI0012FEC140|nr:hypothetical protein [Niallia nealsonii]